MQGPCNHIQSSYMSSQAHTDHYLGGRLELSYYFYFCPRDRLTLTPTPINSVLLKSLFTMAIFKHQQRLCIAAIYLYMCCLNTLYGFWKQEVNKILVAFPLIFGVYIIPLLLSPLMETYWRLFSVVQFPQTLLLRSMLYSGTHSKTSPVFIALPSRESWRFIVVSQ